MTHAAAVAEIGDVIVRYASGIDRRDWDLFRSCFVAACTVDYDGTGAIDGLEALVAFMVDAHAHVGQSLHRISNLAITVDGGRATARSYVDAVLLTGDGATGHNAVGYYDDELVATGDGWRIARRRFTLVRLTLLAHG